MSERIPDAVAEAYELDLASAVPIAIGLINRTYRVARHDGTPLIVQRLHHAFGPAVNEDIDAVTTYVAARGMPTPRLVRTRDGRACVESAGIYRAQTFLDGRVHETVDSDEVAFESGALAGRFHRALAGCSHRFAFTRPGAHDTHAHLARLRAALLSAPERVPADFADVLAAILALGEELADEPPLPSRIIHGDLKITNLLFDTAGTHGVALLDLDTMGYGTLEAELGDALRSWANPRGESDADAYCDVGRARAGLEGFRAGVRDAATADELAAVPRGMARISVELASRFALDVIEDRYFGWDPTRFPSRRAHNAVRARSQLSLARDTVARLQDFSAA